MVTVPFNIVVFTALFLAWRVLSIPVESAVNTDVVPRLEGRRFSDVNNHLQQITRAASSILYGSWAGAAWSESEGTFTTVTGTFTVPKISGSPGDFAYTAIGLDGLACTSAYSQAGVNFTISPDGQDAYYAYHQFYPGDTITIDSMDISPGDAIQLTLVAECPTSSIAIVENLTNGERSETTLHSSTGLCRQDAGWTLSDYLQNNAEPSLADFGTITFMDAVATGTTSARNYFPENATTIGVLEVNDRVVTSVSVNGSSLTIKHL